MFFKYFTVAAVLLVDGAMVWAKGKKKKKE